MTPTLHRHFTLYSMRDALAPSGALARRGFTLIELLVVIAIIGMLAALLLPAAQAAREAARRLQCLSQLKQLALAAHGYHDRQGSFPGGVEQTYFVQPPVHRGFSWIVRLLPYLEQGNRLDRWNYSDPLLNTNGGDASNTAAVLTVLLCPSDVIPQNPVSTNRGWVYGLTSYGGNGGSRSYFPQLATADGIFYTTGEASEPLRNQKPVRLRDVRDGASHTLLCGERSHTDPNFESFADAGWCDRLAEWGWWAPSAGRKMIGHVSLSAHAPINYQVPMLFAARDAVAPPASDPQQFQYYYDLRICAWGSDHPGGANFAFADGSARFMAEQLPLVTLAALSTRSGAEVADE